MNALDDESKIREELQRALDVVDPTAPPFARIAARAQSRRRKARFLGGIGGVALAGACALVAVVVISLNSGDSSSTNHPSKIVPAKTGPTTASLLDYAKANGEVKSLKKQYVVDGPFRSGADLYYGAYAVKKGIDVVTWNGSTWQLARPTITRFASGQFFLKATIGPQIGSPSLYIKFAGGDIAYGGSVLRYVDKTWKFVEFGRYTAIAYGHPSAKVGWFTSVRNDCKPNCAAGTDYRTQWVWSAAQGKFLQYSQRKVNP